MTRSSFASVALALSALTTLSAPIAAQPSPDLIRTYAGTPATSQPFADRQGRVHTLNEFRGKVVIVNLWASWCVPCRVEMPALENVARAHPNDVVVVAISHDTAGWPAVDRFWAGRTTPIQNYLVKDDRIAKQYGAIGLPYSILIDRQGREIGLASALVV